MSCPTFEEWSACADGELDGCDPEVLAAHAANCEPCRGVRSDILALESAVRTAGSATSTATPQLKARLSALKPRRYLGRRALIALGAAGVATLCALALRTLQRPEPFDTQLVGDHVLNALNHEKPLQVTSDDPAVVEKWFEGRLDFDVKLPRLPEATLLGGRLCSVGGRRVALTFYERQGHLMSLFVMEKTGVDKGCAEGIRGFTLCRRSVRGLEYALVTDLPRGEASALLLASLDR